MCYVLLQDEYNFVCGHSMRHLKSAVQRYVCLLNNCSSVEFQTSVHGTPMPYPCQRCIREGRYLYVANSAAAPEDPAAWIPRMSAQQDQVRRPALEREDVPGRHQPTQAPAPVPAPAPAPVPVQHQPAAAPVPATVQQEVSVKEEVQEGVEGEPKRDIKEDIREDVQVILEEEVKAVLGGGELHQNITEEMKEKAKGNVMEKLREVLVREAEKIWNKTGEILEEDVAKVVEKVKEEAEEEVEGEAEEEVEEEVEEDIEEEVKGEVKGEVKEEARVKVEPE